METVLVAGAGGFIGGHLVADLLRQGYVVRAVDCKPRQDWWQLHKADNRQLDLREFDNCEIAVRGIDHVYNLAADMGGAERIFSGLHDAEVLMNSTAINVSMARAITAMGRQDVKVFMASSACVYNQHAQESPDNPGLIESLAYPAWPDSEYGWEKLLAERIWLACAKNHGIQVRIARFHNIAGEIGTWCGGREKAPAAIARKVAEAPDGGEIEIFGDGKQTRSFLHVSDCVQGIAALMRSDFAGPVNIGSEEQTSINNLVKITMEVAGKSLTIKHIPGPLGVRGRNSHNALMKERTAWSPKLSLRETMERIYPWVEGQVRRQQRASNTAAR